tara:strand:+ start:1483 stop:2577 length:1095 start_codon:yes stop_codon:yes gene_type:complete
VTEQNKKICILVEQLGKGGAERSAGLLTQMFSEMGYEVHLATITGLIEYPYQAKLFNMGVYKNEANDIFNKIKRFRLFKKYLDKEKIDVVLDFRFRQNYWKEWLIDTFLYPSVKVIHMVQSYHIAYYLPPNKKSTIRLFSKAFNINTLTEGIKERIEEEYGLKNVSVIPNPVDLENIKKEALKPFTYTKPYIVAAGRMDEDLKQFDKLIIAYAKTQLPQVGVQLRILGRGKLVEDYKQLAESLGVGEDVIFEGFQPNPYPWFKNALFFVLCSKFEGHPRVLIESLACGTPVISMDCKTGPREIIEHEKNGILIPDGDFLKLREQIDRLYEDKNLLEKLSANSVQSVTHFSMEEIAKEWRELLNS